MRARTWRNPRRWLAGGGLLRLARLDFREATIQQKPTIAGVTAMGLPTPTRAYLLTEAGVPFSDGADGAQDLDNISTPGNLGTQRPLVGLSADGSSMQSYTGVEFFANYKTNSLAKAFVTDVSYLDVGAAGSGDVFAIGVLVRCGITTPATTVFLNKRQDAASGGNGWSMGWSSGGAFRLLADDGPSVVLAAVTANVYAGGPWHFAIFRIRRQGVGAELLEILTVYEVVTVDISGLGSLTSTVEFGLGAALAIQNAAGHTQVGGFWVWEGANAAALTQAHAQTFFQHAIDPTGLLTTYTRAGQACDQIGSEPGFGYLLGCYSGVSGSGRTAQVDEGYDALFAHASKLGIRANIAHQNLCTHSDDFSNAAWTKTNVTVATTLANLLDGPDKIRNVVRLTTTAINATIQDTIATVAATEYTQSILLKALPGGGSVAARLIQQNITGGVENAGVDIVITEEWQRFDLTATTAAGQVSTGFRLRIDPNGAVVFAKLATFVLGRRGMLVQTDGAVATMPATNIQATSAAGAWVRGARGEIDLLASCLTPTETYIRRLLVARTGAAENNARLLTIRTNDRTQGAIYDSAAVQDHTIDSAIYDHQPPFTSRLLWRTPSPPAYQPNFLSALVDNGVVVGGSVGPGWANSDTVDTFHIGQSGGVAAQLNGLIALIDFWNLPRGSIPTWPPP